jgi:hypothetical protein
MIPKLASHGQRNYSFTPMKKTLIAALLGLFLSPLVVLADEAVKIGDAAIKIPFPTGFARLDGVNAKLDRVLNGFVAPTNRQLLVLAPPGDVKKAKAGQLDNLARYALVQTFKSAEGETLTVEEFAEVLTGVEKQYGGAGKDARERAAALEQETNKLLKVGGEKVKISGTRMLGAYDKTDRSIDMGMLSDAQAGKAKAQPMACGASILMVGGKIVYLYVYSNLSKAEDVTWTQATAKAWREAIFAANAN